MAERIKEAVTSGGVFKARLTGYWPFAAATEAERRMEGGHQGAAVWRGRKAVDPATGRRVRLHTLEQHLADSSAHPHVSVSADPEVFPWGQRLRIDRWPGVTFRVVDTGGHFKGVGKMYRVLGKEPLDICVNSSKTKVVAAAEASIVKGDHWGLPGDEIAYNKFQGQTVVGGLDYFGRDCEE